jgi:hypothetical protein
MPALIDKLQGHSNTKIPKEIAKNFEQVPAESLVASRLIVDTYEGLGKPKDPFSDGGRKIVDLVIKVWQDLYPHEAKKWFKNKTEHLNAELTISEQVSQQTGRSLASYPFAVYQMLSRLFPDIKFGEKKTCVKMIRHWPMFKMVNRI